ncbi:MAG: acyl-CoA dehydrogenase, partial [bacterium]|nr:acyl-CoA dehydrogenase [bacterium]
GLLVDVGTSNDVVAPYIVDYGSEEMKKQYLPPLARGEYISSVAITEPGTGSDVAAIRTTAVKDGDDYIINGQKTFITSGYYADVIIVAAKTDPKAEPAHAGVSLILVPRDTSGFSVGRKLKKIGSPDSATAELFFEDCRVPQSNLIGEEGGGFGLIMKQFQHERLVVSAMALSVCEMMLSDTVDYCKDRHAFGKPISGFQVNRHKIVDMATQVEIIKVFLYSLYTRFIQGGEDLTKEISMAKYWVCELANRIAYDGVQLHGGYGCMDEYPICRAYRDVRPFTIAAGTTEIMKEIIAKYMGL